jgi:hypothetical protein
MIDPSFELEAAIITRLKADATVSGFVAARIYDRPPDGDVASPYISMGPSDAITDDVDCLPAAELTFQVDCWSSGPGEAFGSAEVRKLAYAVRRSLDGAEITLATNVLVTVNHETTRIMRDPDGATNHAAMTFSALVSEVG